MQVHRSHWIAKRHVRRVKRRGRNLSLLLAGDLEIPVSRAYQKVVRETFGEGVYGSDAPATPAS